MIPEHPAVRNMERTGYADGKEPDYPICPICEEPCDVVYINRYREIVGCDNCIEEHKAWDEPECFPGEEYR